MPSYSFILFLQSSLCGSRLPLFVSSLLSINSQYLCKQIARQRVSKDQRQNPRLRAFAKGRAYDKFICQFKSHLVSPHLALHFGNCPSPVHFTHCKAQGESYDEPRYMFACNGGFLCLLLLKGEGDLKPTNKCKQLFGISL